MIDQVPIDSSSFITGCVFKDFQYLQKQVYLRPFCYFTDEVIQKYLMIHLKCFNFICDRHSICNNISIGFH